MKTVILNMTAHIIAGIMLVFSVYLLLRGHNEPGGGFIAALIAVIAFALLIIAESPGYVYKRLYFSPTAIAMTGIALTLIAGLLSLFAGLPFMTGLWWKDILPLGTPLLFDVGVYFAIIGALMRILLHLKEILD